MKKLGNFNLQRIQFFVSDFKRANTLNNKKQAGTGPSRRHIQGSKIAKRLPSVKYSLLQYSKIENFSRKKFSNFFFRNYILKKMDRVAHRAPLARAPGALKSHNAKKLERGNPLRFFNIHSVAKHEKIEDFFFIFGKKSNNAEKN